MSHVFYLHWNREELAKRVAELKAAGHEVESHWSTETSARFGDALPQVVVISLDRLPSHGRAVAEWFWEAKKRQHIPIIFAGREPDKVEAARKKFPRAVTCATNEVLSTLARIPGAGNLKPRPRRSPAGAGTPKRAPRSQKRSG